MRLHAFAAAVCTTLVLATPVTAIASPRVDRVERAVARSIDAARISHGLRPLRTSPRLARAADRHALDMAWRGRLGHDSSSGLGLSDRVPGSLVAETVARFPRGSRLSRRVVRAWLRSPSHRAVLLDPRLKRIGVARRAGRGGWYFTADLAR